MQSADVFKSNKQNTVSGSNLSEGVNTPLIVGQFRRGPVGKVMRLTRDSFRGELGHDPNNPCYTAVASMLDLVPYVDVVRVYWGRRLYYRYALGSTYPIMMSEKIQLNLTIDHSSLRTALQASSFEEGVQQQFTVSQMQIRDLLVKVEASPEQVACALNVTEMQLRDMLYDIENTEEVTTSLSVPSMTLHDVLITQEMRHESVTSSLSIHSMQIIEK